MDAVILSFSNATIPSEQRHRTTTVAAWISTTALATLADTGAVLMGLDGSEGAEDIFVPPRKRRVLVLGAEGKGLREKTKETVDVLMRLPTNPDFPHLNVSAAAAAAMMMLKV